MSTRNKWDKGAVNVLETLNAFVDDEASVRKPLKDYKDYIGPEIARRLSNTQKLVRDEKTAFNAFAQKMKNADPFQWKGKAGDKMEERLQSAKDCATAYSKAKANVDGCCKM